MPEIAMQMPRLGSLEVKSSHFTGTFHQLKWGQRIFPALSDWMETPQGVKLTSELIDNLPEEVAPGPPWNTGIPRQ